MSLVIAPVVEGHGEVPAIRVLLNLLAPQVQVARPVRIPKTKLTQRVELVRAARIAAANIPKDRTGAVLTLIDADEDCAKALAEQMRSWLADDLSQLRCEVVIAVREFESWIVGGVAEFDVSDPDNAGKLKSRIAERNSGVYSETVDQPTWTSRIDRDLLYSRSRSFRKLCKVVDDLSAQAGNS